MDKIRQLQDMINESNRIVFFGGAGVSTESNIPDFRSADGLYKQKYRYSPEQSITDTGSPNFLFSTSGGISIPPVDAPHLITTPIPSPIIRPPQIVESILSSVTFCNPGTFSSIPRMIG